MHYIWVRLPTFNKISSSVYIFSLSIFTEVSNSIFSWGFSGFDDDFLAFVKGFFDFSNFNPNTFIFLHCNFYIIDFHPLWFLEFFAFHSNLEKSIIGIRFQISILICPFVKFVHHDFWSLYFFLFLHVFLVFAANLWTDIVKCCSLLNRVLSDFVFFAENFEFFGVFFDYWYNYYY